MTKKIAFLWPCLFLYSQILLASLVAVVDSGVDVKHPDLVSHVWVNPLDLPGNELDEDGNGHRNDVHGWNFDEGDARVMHYIHSNCLTMDIRRFFEIQGELVKGVARKKDKMWFLLKMHDGEFVGRLSTCSSFMHGTHVSGIAINREPKIKLLSVKLISVEIDMVNLSRHFLNGQQNGNLEWQKFSVGDSLNIPEFSLPLNGLERHFWGGTSFGVVNPLPGHSTEGQFLGQETRLFLFKGLIDFLVARRTELLSMIAKYLRGHEVDVVNNSFALSFENAWSIVEFLATDMVGRVSDKFVYVHTLYFLQKSLEGALQYVDTSPNMLFVFAAGNEGVDNDQYPSSPANLRRPNTITVGASVEHEVLASFSNFGQTTVDVLAPGVGIRSSVPIKDYVQMTGTSQSTPYVSNVAAQIKDINPKLAPSQIKEIIMKTVDIKDSLRGKVVSSGIVNRERALWAAKLTLIGGPEAALKNARHAVADHTAEAKEGTVGEHDKKGPAGPVEKGLFPTGVPPLSDLLKIK